MELVRGAGRERGSEEGTQNTQLTRGLKSPTVCVYVLVFVCVLVFV